MDTLLLKGALLDGARKDILIEGNRIAAIGDELPGGAGRILDCRRYAVVPSMINLHTHAAMTLVRGFRKENLQSWLDNVWKFEANLDEEAVYWGTKLAILEMLRTGTTTFLDMYWHVPAAARAVEEMGVRGILTYCFLDNFDPEKGRAQEAEFMALYNESRKWSPRVSLGVAVHADYTNTEATIKRAYQLATELDLHFTVHVSETEREMREDIERYGMTPVQHLDALGVIDSRFIGAHALWVSDTDIETLGSRGATVVHNVNSNLLLGSGYKFKYKEYVAAGARVCVGTDGAGSSDNLDIRESLKTASILQKAWRKDPTVLPPEEAFRLATEAGADALGLDAGRIREGALADLALVNVRSEMFVPDYDFTSNLILSANSSCFDTVICDGKIVMENRVVAGEEEILENAARQSERLHRMYNR